MDYHSRRQPFEHQREASRACEDEKAFAFLMAMRTGKTKVTVDDFGDLYSFGSVDDLLITAPAAVYETWVDAIEEDLDPTLFSKLRTHLWKASDQQQSGLAEFLKYQGGPRALLVNIEAFSSVERARVLASGFVGQRRCYAAVDESTTIKNHRAERTKFVLDEIAPRAAFRRILSGLPTPRSPLDIFAQFDFLDPAILCPRPELKRTKRYAAFKKRYAITRLMKVGNHRFEIVVAYKNLEELADLIAPHSYRITLEECYDMPESNWSFRKIQMTPEQARIYRDLKRKATSELKAGVHVTATEVVTQMLRLHQVLCGHVMDESGEVHAIPSNRVSELLNLLAEYDGKAVVWCSYDFNIREVSAALEKEYGEGSVARFWGGNRATREAEEKRFQGDPACRWMVATASAGGRGRMWAVADLVIYFSSTPDLEHRSQSEERSKAVGKLKPISYVDFQVDNSVEVKIIKALRDKIDLAAVITGDDFQEWLI